MENSILNKPENKFWVSWITLVILAVFWGLSFIFIKKVVAVLTPVEVGAGRVLMAALALLPWSFSALKNLPAGKWKPVTLVGFLGYFFPAILYAFAGSKLNSSLAGTLNSTTPLFVLIIGSLFFSQLISKNQLTGLLMGFGGSLLLILAGNDGELNFNNPYALLPLIATVMYGFNVNIIGKYLTDIKPLPLTAASLAVVGVFALGVLFFTDFFAKISLPENRRILAYLIFLGAVNTSMAMILFNFLLQLSSPVFASSVTYLIPVIALLAGIFDGETIAIWHYLGIVIILAGVYMINKKDKLSTD